MALEKELDTYNRQLPTLLSNEGEGKFVLIQGESIVDLFGTYEDALKEGYKRFGVTTTFLVKQISGVEHVQSFTRDITIPCHI